MPEIDSFPEITSADNRRLKIARSIHSSRGVEKSGMFMIEGPRYISDVLEESRPEYLILSTEASDSAREIGHRAHRFGIPVIAVSPDLYSSLDATVHSQGLLAVLALPRTDERKLLDTKRLLVLDGIADPGNIGTAIRSAAAFGCGGVILAKGSCSAFIPKVGRSSAGTNARLPILEGVDLPTFIDGELEGRFLIAGAEPGGMRPEVLDRSKPIALVIGSEARGISEEVDQRVDVRVGIDMGGKVDSLNAGVSASILLFALREP